jgi:type 1 glutamine amidotransferase
MVRSRVLLLVALLCSLPIAPGTSHAADSAAAVGEKNAAKPIRALLITGGPFHDYAKQKEILTKGISARAPVEWTIADEASDKREHKHSIYSKPEWWKGYDVIVHDECFGFVEDDAFIEAIVKVHQDGVPVVAIHCAVHSYRKAKTRAWSEMLGIRSEAHGPKQDIAVTYNAKIDHPITKGLANWTSAKDELYNNIKIYEKTTPLATGKQGDTEAVVAWTNDFHGVRVFVTTLGHTNETVNDPHYLDLITRGLLWAVNRMDDVKAKEAAPVK